MFIELVDRLRCVRPHEDSWLVAAVDRMEARHIVDGSLGCPICGATYPVRDTIADFIAPDSEAPSQTDSDHGGDAAAAPTADEVVRLAALLQLADVQLPVVLCGAWSDVAAPLVTQLPVVVLAVNPVRALPLTPQLSALRTRGALPLAAASAHGIAVDVGAAADRALVDGAVRALHGGGHLVAPADAPLPAGVVLLARDERHWVARREVVAATSAPVPLARRQ